MESCKEGEFVEIDGSTMGWQVGIVPTDSFGLNILGVATELWAARRGVTGAEYCLDAFDVKSGGGAYLRRL